MPKNKMVKKTEVIRQDDLEVTIQTAICLINRKLQSLNNVDPELLDGGELYKLSNSLAGLTRARSEHRKLDTITREAFVQAGSEFKERMKLELQKRPELCEQLIDIADAIQDRA